MEKVDSIEEQIGNIGREKNTKKELKRNSKNKKNGTEMKNAFDGPR